MRKKRIDTHVTLDTVLDVKGIRSTLFRHLEHNTLDFMLITNYNSRNGHKIYCAVIPGTCLHWRIQKESAERYLARVNAVICVDYDTWCIE